MGGTNHPSNIKLLSVKEHALAHKKLYEKYGKWQDKVAWLGLSKTIKGYKLVQLKRRLARLGKKASKETRLKQRLQKLGVPRPDMIGNTLTLGRKANYLFDTGELGFDLKTESGAEIHGQTRSFQYSKARNVSQTDLTPKGRDAGAKLGKVSSVALDEFLQSNNLERPPSASRHPHIPEVGKWNDTDKKYWIDLFNKLKNSSYKIDFGDISVYENNVTIGNTFEQILDKSIEYEKENMNRSSAGRFSSKLISMEWAHIWSELSSKGKLKEWCTVLYYGAKKEFSPKNGPFLKIY